MASNDIQTFRDLDAWKVAMDLCVVGYQTAARLPVTERFERSAQIRRALISIPANVAEGQSCGKDGRYIAHVRIALGSLGELETHLEIARRLKLLSESDLLRIEQLTARTGQLLHGLRRSLMRKRVSRVGSTLALLAVLLFTQKFFAILG
jgi:four helix bundle protein